MEETCHCQWFWLQLHFIVHWLGIVPCVNPPQHTVSTIKIVHSMPQYAPKGCLGLTFKFGTKISASTYYDVEEMAQSLACTHPERNTGVPQQATTQEHATWKTQCVSWRCISGDVCQDEQTSICEVGIKCIVTKKYVTSLYRISRHQM